MSERLHSKELKRTVSYATIIGLSAAALTGCSNYEITEAAPVDRYIADYIWLAPVDGKLEDCLRNSAYDALAGGYGRASFTPPSVSYNADTDILTVTPQQGEPLRMSGFTQYEHTVVAADKASQDILDTYGCEVIEYSER